MPPSPFDRLTTSFGKVARLVRGELDLRALPRRERDLIRRIRARRLTYLSTSKLAALAAACRSAEADGVPGVFVEAGCALGGSAILMASAKRPERPFYVYDVFGMIPPPTEEDTPDVHERYRTIVSGASEGIGGDTYYGYREDLYATVRRNIEGFGIDLDERRVSLIRGLVQDTMHLDEPVAVAHVDVDWYEPVWTCLHRIFPRLSVGGSILLDDYFDWGGCRKATDAFLETVGGRYALDDRAGSLRVTKTRA